MFKIGDFLSQRCAQKIQAPDVRTKSSCGNDVINVKRFPLAILSAQSQRHPVARDRSANELATEQQGYAADDSILHHS